VITLTNVLCAPQWTDELRHRLEAIQQLADGWAGPSTVAPNDTAVSEACSIAYLVQCGTCPLPHISAGEHGEIELAWVGNGIRIEIEVSGTGNASVFVRRPGFADIERPVSLDHPDLRFVAAAITALEPV
jgi:hypothetical protein